MILFQVQVIFQHYVISNLDEYFPKSSEFLPERWLSRDQNNNRHNFASLPFGFGKRMCLGRRFADLEMQIVIAKVSLLIFFENVNLSHIQKFGKYTKRFQININLHALFTSYL